MKRNFLKLLAAAGIEAGGSLTASAAENLRVNVPFSFVMGGLEFQAGQYTLEESNSGVLTLQGEGHGAMAITIPAESGKASATNSLRFVSDGHEYHLVGVQMEGETGRSVGTPTYREHKLSVASR